MCFLTIKLVHFIFGVEWSNFLLDNVYTNHFQCSFWITAIIIACEMTNVASCCCCCVHVYAHFFLITRAESSALKCIIHTGNCSPTEAAAASLLLIYPPNAQIWERFPLQNPALFILILSLRRTGWTGKNYVRGSDGELTPFGEKKYINAQHRSFAVWINSKMQWRFGPPHYGFASVRTG